MITQIKRFVFVGLIICITFIGCGEKNNLPAAVVIQTDFGLKDGAVSAMKGVAHSVDESLPLYDLTHEIPAYNIWEAAYRLNQTVPYWKKGTVFVSVVDPGVGTERNSIVVKTKSGQYIVTPDNGTLTLISDEIGIDAVRKIDETINRREGSADSYTFHGRDVYVYVAARLASGKISFEEVGPVLDKPIVKIPYQHAEGNLEGAENSIKGNIPVLDVQYGNVWTNIPDSLIKAAHISYGDSLDIVINHKDSVVYTGRVLFAHTFGDVPEGKPLAYINSLMNFSLALNMGDFAKVYGIGTGPNWSLHAKKH